MKVSRKGQASPRERKAPAISTQGWGPQRLGQRRDPAAQAGAGSAAFRGAPGRPCSQINTHRKAQAWRPSRAGAFRLSPTARSSEPLTFMQRFTRRDDAGVHSTPLSPPGGRGNSGLGSCVSLATTFSSAHQYITLFYVCFLVAQRVKRLPEMQETWCLIPGLGRSPGEGNGSPLQYSCLENPIDRKAHV